MVLKLMYLNNDIMVTVVSTNTNVHANLIWKN